MDPKTYRAEVEADFAKRAKTAARNRPTEAGQQAAGVREQVATLRNKSVKLSHRQAAARKLGDTNPLTKPSAMKALLEVLGDNNDDPSLRLHCLTVLQATTFQGTAFSRYSEQYVEALRSALAAKDPRVREYAMDVLALRNDPYAQDLLVRGLEDPAAAAVSPVEAVRMLSYDTHGQHYDILRDIVASTDQPELRNLALQRLAADSGAAKTFASIAADRDDDPDARATSAAALKSLDPQRFTKVARQVIGDDSDDEDVRATMLTALTNTSVAASRPIIKEARRIVTSDAAAELKAAAGSYLQRHDGGK